MPKINTNNILDLETAIAGISAVVSPNPYTVGNLISHVTTGQSIGANMPGKVGETVRNTEGAIKDAVEGALESGAEKSKKNNKNRPDFGAGFAYGVGSEQQRRSEAAKMKRNVAYNKGGRVDHKSISACEKSMSKKRGR